MIFRFWRRWHARALHKRRAPQVWLVVSGRGRGHTVYPLNPNRRITVSLSNTVGQPALKLQIVVIDQHGNPMKSPVVPDAPPAWSNTNAGADTLSVAADGMSASATAIAEGADQVVVTATIGGQIFQAALDVTVNPEPQVVSGVQIVVVP